jgi:hypothetical protein
LSIKIFLYEQTVWLSINCFVDLILMWGTMPGNLQIVLVVYCRGSLTNLPSTTKKFYIINYAANEISRHLFEIYGHMVFSNGRRTLKCRCLEDATVTEITLDALNSQRITFGKNTIPTRADFDRTASYYEPTDEDNFPAIDSLSPQGMFQFTVASEHPIRGVQILRKLCNLHTDPELYFVVPPHRFPNFQKQSFKVKGGTNPVNSISKLKQYVLELDVK